MGRLRDGVRRTLQSAVLVRRKFASLGRFTYSFHFDLRSRVRFSVLRVCRSAMPAPVRQALTRVLNPTVRGPQVGDGAEGKISAALTATAPRSRCLQADSKPAQPNS